MFCLSVCFGVDFCCCLGFGIAALQNYLLWSFAPKSPFHFRTYLGEHSGLRSERGFPWCSQVCAASLTPWDSSDLSCGVRIQILKRLLWHMHHVDHRDFVCF